MFSYIKAAQKVSHRFWGTFFLVINTFILPSALDKIALRRFRLCAIPDFVLFCVNALPVAAGVRFFSQAGFTALLL